MEPVRQETWIKDFSNVFISRLKRLFSALKMGGRPRSFRADLSVLSSANGGRRRG